MIPSFATSLNRRHHLPRRTAAALTDLGYLLAAAFPTLQRPLRWWARFRYRRLAMHYARVVDADPTYFAPLEQILDALPGAPAAVVEVGAGTGAATGILRVRYPRALLIAVDLSAAMLAHLATVRAQAVVGEARALPIGTGTADLAVAHNAPFHLRELIRTITPGGAAAVVLSSGGWIPHRLGQWCLVHASPPEAGAIRTHRAGRGIAWVIRRSPGGARRHADAPGLGPGRGSVPR